MSEDPRRIEAKRLHLDKGWTQAAIATHFGVATRTVERWAASDGWGGLKKAKVVEMKARPKAEASEPVPPRRPRAQRGQIDELEVVECAIADLATALETAKCEDLRALGGLAGGLVRLLEYRRKISPPTAAELAELAIALNVSPAEFAQELRKAWRLKA